MDPQTTYALAVVAIVVSLLSVLASGWALVQSSQLHPKPFLVGKVGRASGYEEAPAAQFTITNIGHATAHDLQLVWRSADLGLFEKVWPGELVELAPSSLMVTELSLVSGSTKMTGIDAYGTQVLPIGAVADFAGEFELVWRQDPRLYKIRRRTWTLTSTHANLFATSLSHPVRVRRSLARTFARMSARWGPSSDRARN